MGWVRGLKGLQARGKGAFFHPRNTGFGARRRVCAPPPRTNPQVKNFIVVSLVQERSTRGIGRELPTIPKNKTTRGRSPRRRGRPKPLRGRARRVRSGQPLEPRRDRPRASSALIGGNGPASATKRPEGCASGLLPRALNALREARMGSRGAASWPPPSRSSSGRVECWSRVRVAANLPPRPRAQNAAKTARL